MLKTQNSYKTLDGCFEQIDPIFQYRIKEQIQNEIDERIEKRIRIEMGIG